MPAIGKPVGEPLLVDGTVLNTPPCHVNNPMG